MDRLHLLRTAPRAVTAGDLADAALEDVKHGLGTVELIHDLLISTTKTKGPHRARVKWQNVEDHIADGLDLSIVSSLALKRNATLRAHCIANDISFDDFTNSTFTKIRISSGSSSDSDAPPAAPAPRARRGRPGATRFDSSHFEPPSSSLLSSFTPATIVLVAPPVIEPVAPEPPAPAIRLGTRGLGIARGSRAGVRR